MVLYFVCEENVFLLLRVFPGSLLLLLPGGQLVRQQLLVEGNDFVLLPEVVWRAFTLWYGTAGHSGGPPLPRTVSNSVQSPLSRLSLWHAMNHMNYHVVKQEAMMFTLCVEQYGVGLGG